MKVIAVIPARYASTRFPGKPLAVLAGKTIIRRVYEAAVASKLFNDVIVATDDDRIIAEMQSFGGQVARTRADHQSGSDRIAEVARRSDADVIVNIQGDEPFITEEPLGKLLAVFNDPHVRVASLMTMLPEGVENPNFVKVVTDLQSNALYFSRSPIPFDRDATGEVRYQLHIGVYAYRREALLHFVGMQQSPLEKIEKLEQLRLLENGIPIRMVRTSYRGFGIDTPEDLENAEALLK